MTRATAATTEAHGRRHAGAKNIGDTLKKLFPEEDWPEALSPSGLVQLMASKRKESPTLAGLHELLAAMVRPPAGPALDCAARVDAMIASELAFAARERVVALPLDGAGRPMWMETLGRGGIDRCDLPMRPLMELLLRAGARRVILAHNHPSGDPSPSAVDRQMSEILAQRLEGVGFELVDHLVISRVGYASALWPGAVQRRAWLKVADS